MAQTLSANRKIASSKIWLSVAGGVLLLLACWRFLILKHQIPIDGNMLTLYYPNWTYATEMLSHGHWPLWNPFRDMGEPFFADPQTLAAYPVFWLMTLIHNFWGFLVAWYLFHCVLAAVFFGLLAYHYKPQESVACMAAIVGGFNGFLSHLSPNVFASTAWVPAVLYFAVRGSILGMGFCLAGQWLAGFPDFSLLTVGMVIWITLNQGKAGLERLIVGGLLTLGLVSFQFIPFLTYFSHTVRPLLLSSTDAIQFSLQPRELAKVLLLPQWTRFYPQLSGDPAVMAFYIGPAALLLSLWAMIRGGWREKRWAIAVGLCLTLSMGKYLPGFSSMRFLHLFCYPAHWLLLASIGLTLLAALGVAHIPSPTARRWAIGIVALDLIFFAQIPRVAWVDPSFLTTTPPLAQDILKKPYPTRIYHTRLFQRAWHEQDMRSLKDFDRFRQYLAPSFGMAFGVADVESHQVLLLKRTAQFQDQLEKSGPASAWVQDAGISMVVTIDRSRPGIGDGTTVIELKPARPPLYLLPDSQDAHFLINRLHPGFTDVTVETKNRRTLVFNQIADAGWKARIDGIPVSLQPYLDTFIAAEVSPGIHRIIYSYEPSAVRWGWVVTFLTLLFLVARFSIGKIAPNRITALFDSPHSD